MRSSAGSRAIATCRCSSTSGPTSCAGRCARACSCAPPNSSGRRATPRTPTATTPWPRRCKMLEVYREFAEDVLAMPVIAGEKPENERFPGAVNTYSIEAMMQDGKALQAGTSHYLGTQLRRSAEHPASRTAKAAARLLPHDELGRVHAPDRRRDHDARRRRRPAAAAEDRAAPDRHRAHAARQAGRCKSCSTTARRSRRS